MLYAAGLASHKSVNLLNIPACGRITVLCGPNGSGKSAILECLASGNYTEGVRDCERFRTVIADASAGAPPEQKVEFAAFEQAACKRFDENGCLLREDTQAIWGDQMSARGRPAQDAFAQWCGGLDLDAGFIKKDRFRVLHIKTERQYQLISGLAPAVTTDQLVSAIASNLFHAKSKPRGPALQQYEAFVSNYEYISEGVKLEVEMLDDRTIRLGYFAGGTDEYRLLQDSGKGLQDLAYILYHLTFNTCELLLIDEVEQHMHPALLRRFMEVLGKVDRQVILATHSGVVAASPAVDVLYQTGLDQQARTFIEEVTSRARLLSMLGYSVIENIAADVILLLEGPTDVPLLTQLCSQHPVLGKKKCQFWPLGGGTMARIDPAWAKEVSTNVFALVDADPGSAAAQSAFATACRNAGIKLTRLTRYAIENYIPLSHYQSVSSCSGLPSNYAILPNVKVHGILKGVLADHTHDLAATLQLADVSGTDLGQFLDDVAAAI
jgi:predicted ATPase